MAYHNPDKEDYIIIIDIIGVAIGGTIASPLFKSKGQIRSTKASYNNPILTLLYNIHTYSLYF